jgi:hypothetical protein
VRLKPFFQELLVQLHRRVVQTQLDYGEIRVRLLQVTLQAQMFHREFRLVEFIERGAEVDEHQVALVTKHGEECRLALLFHRTQRLSSLFQDREALAFAQFVPLRPAEAKHLVQHAVTFQRDRVGGHFRGHNIRATRHDGFPSDRNL